MAMSRTEINAKSEAKRGIVNKSFKIHHTVAEQVDRLSETLGISKGKVLEKAIQLLDEQTKA